MANYDWDQVGSILIKSSLEWNNCQPRQVPYTAGKIFGSYPEEDGGFSDLKPIRWGCWNIYELRVMENRHSLCLPACSWCAPVFQLGQQFPLGFVVLSPLKASSTTLCSPERRLFHVLISDLSWSFGFWKCMRSNLKLMTASAELSTIHFHFSVSIARLLTAWLLMFRALAIISVISNVLLLLMMWWCLFRCIRSLHSVWRGAWRYNLMVFQTPHIPPLKDNLCKLKIGMVWLLTRPRLL